MFRIYLLTGDRKLIIGDRSHDLSACVGREGLCMSKYVTYSTTSSVSEHTFSLSSSTNAHLGGAGVKPAYLS